MSSQGLKHAIHSRHKYWHEHAHHDTRHEVTQLEDTTWPSSDASKRWKEKNRGKKREKEKSLESTAASDERWRTKRSRGEFSTVLHVWQYTVCPCCKHEGRHSLRTAKAGFGAEACFQFNLMMVHSWFHINRTKTQTKSKCESGIDSNTVLLNSRREHITGKKQEWLHMCTRIQRRNTKSNRGDKTAWLKVVSLPAERLLKTFWQGETWAVELWMVSLFKIPSFIKERRETT